MQLFPHHYRTSATASSSGSVSLGSPGLPDLATAAPPEFNGPEGFWSPETLLVGAVADCFILSFRAVTQASKFDWVELRVEVEGTLDRVEGVNRFTHFKIRPHLTIPATADRQKAMSLLERAERVCLVSNSLNGVRELDAQVTVAKE